VALLIFETKKAQKILLRISTDLDVEQYILRFVCRNYSVPDNGGPIQVAKCDGCHVFVWKFGNATACSQVLSDDVKLIKSVKIIEGDSMSRGKLSYSYFTLKVGKVPNENDVYPNNVLESKRVDAFSTSLQKAGYIVHTANSRSHYCEFSGGGDIYIENAVEVPLVFKSVQLANDVETDDVNDAAKLSPTHPGTQKLAQLSIEGKRGAVSVSAGIGQLWANMMLICVERFVDSCENFKKEDLISIQQLTGYGILCCGDGTIAAYKLEINFNVKNSIIQKIEPSTYNRVKAAKLMDYVIECF